jgi:hypothetical protein
MSGSYDLKISQFQVFPLVDWCDSAEVSFFVSIARRLSENSDRSEGEAG